MQNVHDLMGKEDLRKAQPDAIKLGKEYKLRR